VSVRITDPEIIRKQERQLFEAITENLDWEALSSVFRSHHRLGAISSMVSRQGDFVARQGAVAYRLDFDVRAVMSVLFDRAGNYLETGDVTLASEPGLPQAPLQDTDAPGGLPEETGMPPAPEPFEEEEPEVLGLDQIIRNRRDMIVEPAVDSMAPSKPPPGERMSRMADELAGMISDINGKKKR
jgi:hypothetical protein